MVKRHSTSPDRLGSLALLALSLFAVQGAALGMTCPNGPEQMAVPIPDPNPAPAPGNFALNIDGLLPYFAANNITNVKQFIDHFPRILNSHYTVVERTGALHQTSIAHPGLLAWGDGRFMVNLGTNPADSRYEVVDLAYLQPNGDWQFDAIDFRTSPPTRRGSGECTACHGTPARPIWGNYLDWPGMFADNGAGQEILTNAQASRLTQVKNQQASSQRFHKLEIADYLFDRAGVSMHLPKHAYGPGLTISNTEMGAAVGESLFKRAQRSSRYSGLREEYLALSYCDTFAGVLSSSKRNEIKNLITSLGGTTTGWNGSPHWTDIYRLWGLNPEHEFPLHLKTGVPVTQNDLNWNTGVSRLREVVDQLILWQLAQESSAARNVLQGYGPSYSMTQCGNHFSTLYQHTQHKIYAMHTLKGNARWAARTGNGTGNRGYYDIDYLRIHQAWNNIRSPICNLLTQTVGTGTIGRASNAPPAAVTATSESHDVRALLKAVSRTGLSGAAGSVQHFTMHVHGQPPANLRFQTSGGRGDVDIYVKHGSPPTLDDHQCRPYKNGNSEICNFATAEEGPWYVMLHARRAYSGVTLSGDFNDNYSAVPPLPETAHDAHTAHSAFGGGVPNACATRTPVYDAPLTKGVAECVTGSPGPGYYRHFYIRLAAADAGKTLVIRMGNGTGNANMLVSIDLGLFPHEEHYAARPDIVFGSTGPNNEETVTISNARAGRDYLITLPAVTPHAGISIVATVQ